MSAPNAVDEEILTEASAFTEILRWSKDRPAWQRDALRRLAQGRALSDVDVEELLAICLDPEAEGDPLSEAHVSAQASAGEPIGILRVEDPKGINALASDQKLEFAPEGLTVVYGDNGSGKSGYVRVLKHACRTRDRTTKILHDIESAGTGEQAAKIVFRRGQAEDSFDWTPEAPSHAELPSVSIFDSRSANVHVEKTNAVAYIPLPMQVLEALATACDQIKERLDAKVKELAAQTPLSIKDPQLNSETAAGSFVHNLSAKSSIAQLGLLATLSEAEELRLSALETDLALDPRRAAARVTNQRARLSEAASKLGELCDAVSDAKFDECDRLRAIRDAKARAAKLASEELFAASPLPQVGQAVWLSLWESARKYSDVVAYPDRVFPQAMEGDELCVLCQQPMGAEAIERRITFESFVQGSTRADESAAADALSAALNEAMEVRISPSDIRQMIRLIGSEIGDVTLSAAVRACAIRSAWRLRAFCNGSPAAGAEPAFPRQELDGLIDSLSRRAVELSADETSPIRVALVKEHQELKDRKALTALLPDIKAEIGRLVKAEAIFKAAKDTAKRSVTTKNKELSDKLVTNALRGRFAREIEKLKLSRMPVELRKVKDQNAVSYFQVSLVEKPEEPVGEIFSEGEHRCVALAAFLAELVTSKRYSAIVFDDPMSSLDHIHRKAVAARLIEESAHRQVIVFTHDLTFLFELRREAESKARAIAYQTVCRKQSRPGFVEAELPMKAKSAWQLGQALRSELKEAKPLFDSWPDVRRTIFCKGIIEQLREAWDQGIADFIFPVLGRFDNSIKGSSLYRLAVLSEDDVKTTTAARGRLSEELHTSSETLNPETVTHADLVTEVVKLETWLADIKARQASATAPVTSYA